MPHRPAFGIIAAHGVVRLPLGPLGPGESARLLQAADAVSVSVEGDEVVVTNRCGRPQPYLVVVSTKVSEAAVTLASAAIEALQRRRLR